MCYNTPIEAENSENSVLGAVAIQRRHTQICVKALGDLEFGHDIQNHSAGEIPTDSLQPTGIFPSTVLPACVEFPLGRYPVEGVLIWPC